MKITHQELNDFWNEVLGDDFYLEEGIPDWTGEEPPNAILTVEDYAYVAWQGKGELTYPTFIQSLLNQGWEGDPLSLIPLINAWRAQQTHAFLSIKVPSEHLDALNTFLATINAETLT